jgi:hypothetical protein
MRSRDHDVVLVGRTIDLRCWEFGMGRGWEAGGQFTSNLRPRWTGSHHAKGGFPNKKKGNGMERNRDWQGEQNKGIAP